MRGRVKPATVCHLLCVGRGLHSHFQGLKVWRIRGPNLGHRVYRVTHVSEPRPNDQTLFPPIQSVKNLTEFPFSLKKSEIIHFQV